MRIAITGAAGGLGRRVTAALEPDHELLLLDAVAPEEATVFDMRSPTGRRLAPLTPHSPYLKIDIGDPDATARALAGIDVVIHLAGHPTGEWERARDIMQTNVLGTFTVYEAARATGVRRVVNASSINAFGTFFWRVHSESPIRARLPLIEDEPRVPEDPYSLSKGITEEIGATFRRAFGIEAVNLRFAAVWSEERYAELTENGLPRTESWSDDLFQWVHPDDVRDGIVLAATVGQTTSEPMVLAAPDTRAPEDTLELIRRFRPELERDLREPLVGRASLLSTARARAFLGYDPSRSFAAAAERTRA
jgi:nucleoside-diphosphate-sugar epimerase